MLAVALFDPLHPLFLADSHQIDRPIIRNLARAYGMRPLPDVNEAGTAVRAEVERVLLDCATHLREGGNVVLYPSGHLYRSRYENLRGNSAAQRVLKSVPDARVVMVRIRGLWGSGFGHALGREPHIGSVLRRAVLGLLQSGIFFAPHREVAVQRGAHRTCRGPAHAKTSTLVWRPTTERGRAAEPLCCPYSVWDRNSECDLPDPVARGDSRDASKVPEATRRLVLDHLKEVSGVAGLTDGQDLARDLGLDSLMRAELLVWIQKETGLALAEATTLQTVADVLLAAVGEATSTLSRSVARRPQRPGSLEDSGRCSMSPKPPRTIPEVLPGPGRSPAPPARR